MNERRGLFRSAGRFAGLAIAVALAVVVAQGVFIVADLQREADLHREVLAAQSAKDGLERLRLDIVELHSAARFAAATGEPQALQDIERLSVELDAELGYLDQALGGADPLAGVEAMAQSARLLALRARSVKGARAQGGDAASGSAELAAIAQRALDAARAVLVSQARRLNERTADRIRVGENVRVAVRWTFAAAGLVLVALFVAYRRARIGEADALRRVEWLAHWDTVTGLPNRALLEDRLAQEVVRARRTEQAFSVVMFDLDGFKAVNDTLGHAAGDRLLALVADRCRAVLRASDTIGRISGDEFLAILPESAPDGAREVAEKLRAAVAEPYEIDRKRVTVTASLGVAGFPAHGLEPDRLKAAADAALYDAKRRGKNRVAVAEGALAAPAGPGAEA